MHVHSIRNLKTNQRQKFAIKLEYWTRNFTFSPVCQHSCLLSEKLAAGVWLDIT